MSIFSGLFSVASSLLGGVSSVASTAGSLYLNQQQYKAAQSNYDSSIAAAQNAQTTLTKLANTELYYNQDRLASAYYDNLQLNFSQAAGEMYDLTRKYIDQSSNITMSYANQGGIGFNSGNNDSQRSLQLDYAKAMSDVKVGRDWTEQQLSEEYETNVFQQDINYYKNISNINLAYQNTALAAEQKLLNASVGLSQNNYNTLLGSNSSSNIFSTVSSGANYISKVLGGN